MKIILKILGYLLVVVLIGLLLAWGISMLGAGLSSIGLNISDLVNKNEPVPEVVVGEGFKGKENGGLTEEEVKKYINEDLPKHDDVFRDFIVLDFENHVAIFRNAKNEKGENILPNLLFVKTKNGLVWDGAIGVNAYVPVKYVSGWHEFENTKFTLNLTFQEYERERKNPPLLTALNLLKGSWLNTGWNENVVSFSDFKTDYAIGFWNMGSLAMNLWVPKEDRINTLKKLTHDYLMKNVVEKYFCDLTDLLTTGSVEFVGKDFGNINSFATHVYNNSKNKAESIVDLSNYFKVFVNEEEAKTFPIPSEKQIEYNNAKYYVFYNAKVLANVVYKKSETKIPRDLKTIEKNTTGAVVNPQPTNVIEYSKVSFKLRNFNNSDLTGFSISEMPVQILINDQTILFKNPNDLNFGKTIALEKNKTYYYQVVSQGLLFEKLTGQFEIKNTVEEKIFDYSYNSGLITVSVSLKALNDIHVVNFDLSKNPVEIELKHDDGTVYNFIFNNNATYHVQQTKNLKPGNYSFSIFSNEFKFNPTTGQVVVSSEFRFFVFKFEVEQPFEVLDLKLSATTITYSDSESIKFVIAKELLNDIVSKIGTFMLDIKFVDEEGVVLKSMEIAGENLYFVDLFYFGYYGNIINKPIKISYSFLGQALSITGDCDSQLFDFSGGKILKLEFTKGEN